MAGKSFWIAAIATALGTVGLAFVIAQLWAADGGKEGAMSGAFLGSALSLVGFGLLRSLRNSSMAIFGLFFLLKMIALVSGALLLSKFPQYGRYEFYLAGFLGGALMGSIVGAFFLLAKPVLKEASRV